MWDADRAPVADAELDALFAPFRGHDRILIALSGGPDSTALLHLAVRWRAASGAPALHAATVDHALRPGSAAEAHAAGRAAAALGVPHVVLSWTGAKPSTGIQAAAREARYALLAGAARAAGASAIALGHTLDDQAETVLFRLARGSGLAGLAAMRPASQRAGLALLRPLLGVPKARLVATLEAAGIGFSLDPSNLDARFRRPRLRALMPALAAEELDARRLAAFARRAARADAALEAATDAAATRLAPPPWPTGAAVRIDRAGFSFLPEEVALRLLGRAIDHAGTEGPVELGKLEALAGALAGANGAASATGAAPFRRTLAGALVAVRGSDLVVCPAPPRRERGEIARNSSVAGAGILGKSRPRS